MHVPSEIQLQFSYWEEWIRKWRNACIKLTYQWFSLHWWANFFSYEKPFIQKKLITDIRICHHTLHRHAVPNICSIPDRFISPSLKKMLLLDTGIAIKHLWFILIKLPLILKRVPITGIFFYPFRSTQFDIPVMRLKKYLHFDPIWEKANYKSFPSHVTFNSENLEAYKVMVENTHISNR